MSHRNTRNKPLTDKPAVFRKTYAAFLFDMDGTLLSSIAAAERVWGAWAERHGLDVEEFLPTIHGVRAEDTIRRQNIAGIDVDAEVRWVERAEIDDVEGVHPIDGIVDFLNALPSDKWAIVTSATLELASKRLAAAGILSIRRRRSSPPRTSRAASRRRIPFWSQPSGWASRRPTAWSSKTHRRGLPPAKRRAPTSW
jgi:hypothetical protein